MDIMVAAGHVRVSFHGALPHPFTRALPPLRSRPQPRPRESALAPPPATGVSTTRAARLLLGLCSISPRRRRSAALPLLPAPRAGYSLRVQARSALLRGGPSHLPWMWGGVSRSPRPRAAAAPPSPQRGSALRPPSPALGCWRSGARSPSRKTTDSDADCSSPLPAPRFRAPSLPVPHHCRAAAVPDRLLSPQFSISADPTLAVGGGQGGSVGRGDGGGGWAKRTGRGVAALRAAALSAVEGAHEHEVVWLARFGVSAQGVIPSAL
jgi:hypothetical protein